MLAQRLSAEFMGTLLLVATVVGSGIMGDALSDDTAVSLLGNTLPTGAILFVIITLFAPISGAHFNPVVTGVFWLRGELSARDALLYIPVQIGGGIAGSFIAHIMFDLRLIQLSETVSSGTGQYFSESVASFGLLLTMLMGLRSAPQQIPILVCLYITAAYWFTSSTSFANPAVTIARSLSDTFAGIRPSDVPMFILCQILGALGAAFFVRYVIRDQAPS